MITDTTVTEPAFVVERFGPKGDRLEVAGHWHGLRGRRFVRPVLWLHRDEGRRRLVAVLDHKPWAADDGDPWMAAFAWDGGALKADKVELDVGRELVVELPLPGRKAPSSTPARPRQPSELERVRDQLTAAARERRALQEALDTATSHAGELEQVRDERDRALEAAEQARADGERLVNDEYRQRQGILEAAERAAERARDTEAALDLARRQLAAARKSYVALEAERDHAQRQVQAATAESDEARTQLEVVTAERDQAHAETEKTKKTIEAARVERDEARREVETLRERLAGATVEHDVLAEPVAADPPAPAPRVGSEELAAARAEQQRLEAELAGAWADREQLVAELVAARDGRERVEAELVSARSDRKRLERELARRSEAEPRHVPTVRVTPQPFTPRRSAPPSSGGGLWLVRVIALAMVIALLAAVALLVTGVF
jgi:DNA repair exonuclease SbcCD ATPase subunit